jgi:hypothetical protein
MITTYAQSSLASNGHNLLSLASKTAESGVRKFTPIKLSGSPVETRQCAREPRGGFASSPNEAAGDNQVFSISSFPRTAHPHLQGNSFLALTTSWKSLGCTTCGSNKYNDSNVHGTLFSSHHVRLLSLA